MSSDRALVVVELDALETLIERAVARVLASRSAANDAPAEWLDARGVAKILGVNPRSVAKYVERGLPCRRVGPRTVRYLRDEVEAWIAARAG